MTKKADAFQFACYDAIQSIGKPSTVKMIAMKIGKPSSESAVRKVLNTLCEQKALSKKKIKEVWHYFV